MKDLLLYTAQPTFSNASSFDMISRGYYDKLGHSHLTQTHVQPYSKQKSSSITTVGRCLFAFLDLETEI